MKKVCDKANLTSSQVKGFYAVRIKKTFTLEDEILNAGLTFEKLEKKVCKPNTSPLYELISLLVTKTKNRLERLYGLGVKAQIPDVVTSGPLIIHNKHFRIRLQVMIRYLHFL